MSTLSVTARGVDTLTATLADAADYFRAGMPDAEAAAADLIAATARATTAPRRTGRLAASIGAAGGTVVAAVPYARPVHARTPFVTTAKAHVEARLVEVFDTDAVEALARVRGS